ncbi:MAG: hypothetical protein L0027_18285, partial [Candidatus Rokubacteria bacterium]|nr:hypothetical protein [Candidatus Rokubacteria bacterium]
MALRIARGGGGRGEPFLIAYRLDRSLAWNAAHVPRLPARPRKLGAERSWRLFDHRIEAPIGLAAGPLPTSRWIEAYARLGYGLLTYGTVRTQERAALPHPNLVFCRATDPAVVEPRPRKIDPARVTWAVSTGLPSVAPEVWRPDVIRARARMRPGQLLVVSVAGTPAPGGDGEQLALDYAQAARWAAEAGADVIEVHLAGANLMAEHAQMVFENHALSAHIAERVRRVVGGRPVVAT